MLTRPLTPGERILEVGCGLALASLVCHRRGDDVTASDAHPLALSFLAENVLLNDLMPLPYRHGNWATQPDGNAPHHPHPVVSGRFNVIMGSDVLYERDEPGHLAGFIERHACPTAEVIIVDPNRGNRPAFTRRMSDQGFLLNETHLSTPEADGLPYRGRLLRYSRTAALNALVVP